MTIIITIDTHKFLRAVKYLMLKPNSNNNENDNN